MFRAFLNDIILKARRNSVNWPAHETEVHDVMETVDAIDFVTSGVLFRAVNLECVPKDCLVADCWADIELFLRLKAERKIVVLSSSVARVVKFCLSNKSLIILGFLLLLKVLIIFIYNISYVLVALCKFSCRD